MIIDTNGFEIGDMIWYVDYRMSMHKILYYSTKSIICGFIISNYGELFIETDTDIKPIHIEFCFKDEQDAITYCNIKNGNQ